MAIRTSIWDRSRIPMVHDNPSGASLTSGYLVGTDNYPLTNPGDWGAPLTSEQSNGNGTAYEILEAGHSWSFTVTSNGIPHTYKISIVAGDPRNSIQLIHNNSVIASNTIGNQYHAGVITFHHVNTTANWNFLVDFVYLSMYATEDQKEDIINSFLANRFSFGGSGMIGFNADSTAVQDGYFFEWWSDDESGEAGGDGGYISGDASWDMDSDTIDDPTSETLPDLAIGSGFNTLYKVTHGQMTSLASWLWSGGLADIVNKWLNGDPMNAIVDYYALPLSVSAGTATHIVCGGTDSEVSSNKVLNQYQTVDCGSISLLECFASYLDYSPLTKLEIYLPYIGIRQLDTDEITGCSSISVKYKVDVTNGDFTAIVYIQKPANRNNNANGFAYPSYHFSGNMAYHIPWSAAARNAFMTGVLGAAPAAAGVGIGLATGNAAAVVGGLVAGGAMAATLNKPTVQKGGSLSGSTGWMDNQKPFLIINRPVQNTPANFGHHDGWIANITKTVNDCSGFTKFAKAHVEGVGCTSDENEMIHQALLKGIIV